MRPLGKRVLVRVLPEDWTRPSGLIIPENVQTDSCQGIVEKVGSRVRDVQVGQRILFGSYQETGWRDGDTEWLLIERDDILAVVDDGEGG